MNQSRLLKAVEGIYNTVQDKEIGMEILMNNWKEVWNRRTIKSEDFLNGDKKTILLELKRCNGFDVTEEMSYESFYRQYEEIRDNLHRYESVGSVYEVGCGSGANLYLFEDEGYETGGLDYSHSLIRIAEKVLKTKDILCAEAVNIPSDVEYDAVFSNSVFSYFESEKYAERVLQKMYQKAKKVIGLIDIHDVEKKEDFVSYRRKIIEDYDKRYADLPKLFYPKQFFRDFADKNGMNIVFLESDIKGYWNNQFVYSCYMYKKAAEK